MANGANDANAMLAALGDGLQVIDTTHVCAQMEKLTYSQFDGISYILLLGDSVGKIDIAIPTIGFACSYQITNPNLREQKGLFLMNFKHKKPIEQVVREHQSCYPPQIICVDINKSLVQEIIDTYCMPNNVNRDNVYPQNADTENLRRWLNGVGVI